MTPNKETQEILSNAGDWATFIGHPCYFLWKQKLNDRMAILDSWSSLPDGLTSTQKAKEMDNRLAAISIIKQLMQEVEGTVENGAETAKAFSDPKNSESEKILARFPEVKHEYNQSKI